MIQSGSAAETNVWKHDLKLPFRRKLQSIEPQMFLLCESRCHLSCNPCNCASWFLLAMSRFSRPILLHWVAIVRTSNSQSMKCLMCISRLLFMIFRKFNAVWSLPNWVALALSNNLQQQQLLVEPPQFIDCCCCCRCCCFLWQARLDWLMLQIHSKTGNHWKMSTKPAYDSRRKLMPSLVNLEVVIFLWRKRFRLITKHFTKYC